MNQIVTGVLGVVAVLGVFGGIVYGYIHNIVSLVTNTEQLGLVAGRCLGIFVAPLGVVLGYF